MQSKTTRAFRTISEAGDELGLQPHVLRFWESKFPQIKPIKRGGGRRFYRPEDIEFLRGIKILLHDEKHPIKDVQKLIRVKGPGRVMELGRSVQIAANPKNIKDTVLIPDRIIGEDDADDRRTDFDAASDKPDIIVYDGSDDTREKYGASDEHETYDYVYEDPQVSSDLNGAHDIHETLDEHPNVDDYSTATSEAEFVISRADREALEQALSRLETLKQRWQVFREA